VKLDTNGSRPGVLRGLLAEGTLDFVAMDVKAPWARYAELTGLDACDTDAVRESLALVAASGVAHHFRTTRVDPLLSERDYEAIRRQIPAGSPHVWQTFRPVKEEIAS
jgi:pyruvate formate lyase activating enzyme